MIERMYASNMIAWLPTR